MPYLTHISVGRLRHLHDFDIKLTPQPGKAFSHLVLTGPNGSGKTTLLDAIADECLKNAQGNFSHRENTMHALEMARSIQGGLSGRQRSSNEETIATLAQQLEAERASRPVQLGWNLESKLQVGAAFATGDSIFFYMPARRQLNIATVTGPNRLSLSPSALLQRTEPLGTSVASYVLQLMVNKKTERTFAKEDGDSAAVALLDQWLERLKHAFGVLLEDPNLEMRFHRNAWTYSLIRPRDGREFNLYQLAHGHSSAIQLFAELLVRFEVVQQSKGDASFEPSGVVIIDEVETHLHLRLQETILPFLTKAFPTIQFVVATHSPVIVASVADAVVFDLERREGAYSDTLQGIRYGDLVTGYFGVRSEYDLDTQHKLEELERLFAKGQRAAEEESRMRVLADELAAKSHSLALDILLRLKVATMHGRGGAPEGNRQ